ncbi:U3 small nucleolar ribonucleoprotein IMP3, partial [Eschrichtius robustus]|nr:U3 small nucleolar ribonucleoprotein IMP3 [Eschrichtius robustus]
MVWKLKFREQKLLKHMVFLNWEATDHNLQELRVSRCHRLQRYEDDTRYNQLSLAGRASCACATGRSADGQASSFCRRSLPTVLLELRLAQHLQAAVAFVEQGHVRVGPDVVTDPAFLVTRSMEDFVTWVDSSKIKRHVLEYNEERDDFDLEA